MVELADVSMPGKKALKVVKSDSVDQQKHQSARAPMPIGTPPSHEREEAGYGSVLEDSKLEMRRKSGRRHERRRRRRPLTMQRRRRPSPKKRWGLTCDWKCEWPPL